MENFRQTIGILGGMGPAATRDLYDKIISQTPAGRDQDHLRIFIDSNPQIPDRTKALNENGEDPVPYMLDSAKRLEKAGVDFIIVPCNTAHAFVSCFAKELNIPFLSMIETCAKSVLSNYPEISKVGLLATSGTVNSGLYAEEFKKYGVEVIALPEGVQEANVMEAIYGQCGIKSGKTEGKPHDLLQKAAEVLKEAGAEVILMACTEIPLALHQEDIDVPLIDPTNLLARAAVEKALAYKPTSSK